MVRRVVVNFRDILAGTALAALGLFTGLYSWWSYPLGTFISMGPGMFPLALGVLLVGCGVVVFLGALFRPGNIPKPNYRAVIAALSAVLVFAVTESYLGMVPAIFFLTTVSALADTRLTITVTVLLAASLSVIAVLIFPIGLGMTISLFKWPF